MQQHEGWPAARKVADVQAAAIALNSMFGEGREICPLRIRHDLAPLAWWSLSSTCSRAGTSAKPSSGFPVTSRWFFQRAGGILRRRFPMAAKTALAGTIA